jgi:hypothetical protein
MLQLIYFKALYYYMFIEWQTNNKHFQSASAFKALQLSKRFSFQSASVPA